MIIAWKLIIKIWILSFHRHLALLQQYRMLIRNPQNCRHMLVKISPCLTQNYLNTSLSRVWKQVLQLLSLAEEKVWQRLESVSSSNQCQPVSKWIFNNRQASNTTKSKSTLTMKSRKVQIAWTAVHKAQLSCRKSSLCKMLPDNYYPIKMDYNSRMTVTEEICSWLSKVLKRIWNWEADRHNHLKRTLNQRDITVLILT